MIRASLLLVIVVTALQVGQERGATPPGVPWRWVAMDPQPADSRGQTEEGWRFCFLLKTVKLPRNGRGQVLLTGALRNEGRSILYFDETYAEQSVSSELRFWEVGTPYVYRLRQNPMASIDYVPGVAQMLPGATKQIRSGTVLMSDEGRVPLHWFARTRSDSLMSKEDDGRFFVLPAGLYGVSSVVEIWPMEPEPKSGSRDAPCFEVRSQNMLWMEVGVDGTATALATRPAY